jgi:type I restriction enzyme S subunit
VTRIETISKGTIDLERVGYLANLPSETIQKYRLIPDDILFSNINSDAHLGKTAIFHTSDLLLLHGMNLLLVRTNQIVLNSDYLNYLFNYFRFKGVFYSIAQHAVNQSSINQTKLNSLKIPLPPLPEQHRIVTKIEELFTRLDDGVNELKKVQLQLKRYRQSVLKSAFDGTLTAEWRKAHKDELEPASVLLERIKEERKKSGIYKEFPSVDTINLPELPEGWAWTKIKIIASVMDVDHKMPKSTDTGISFISPKDFVYPYGVDFNKAKRISIEDYTRLSRKCKPELGDLLYSRIGTVGKVRKVPDSITFQISYSLCIIRLTDIIKQNGYIYWLLQSPQIMEQALKNRRSIGVPDLGLADIKEFLIPIPSLNEQQYICEEISRCFSIADEIETTTEQSLKQSQRLRQSILKRGFEGKLVPQNPADKPADKLLERIKAEKAKNKVNSKQGKAVNVR